MPLTLWNFMKTLPHLLSLLVALIACSSFVCAADLSDDLRYEREVFTTSHIKPRNPGLFGRNTQPTGPNMELVAHDWMPANFAVNPPKGLFVVGTHGLREALSGRMAMIKRLVSEGFIVTGFDLPGAGESPNLGGDQSAPDGLIWDATEVTAEVRAYVKRKQEQHRIGGAELPTILYGHSFGGAVALDASLEVINHPEQPLLVPQETPPKLRLTIASAPGEKPFLYQSLAEPVLRALNWINPKLRAFPLFNAFFISPEKAPPGFYEGSPAELPTNDVDRDGRPVVGTERALRPSHAGEFHPLATAIATVDAYKRRDDSVDYSGESRFFNATGDIAIIHPYDLTTRSSSTARFMAERTTDTGGKKVAWFSYAGDGHRHADINDPAYIDLVVGLANNAIEGKSVADYKQPGTTKISYRDYVDGRVFGRERQSIRELLTGRRLYRDFPVFRAKTYGIGGR